VKYAVPKRSLTATTQASGFVNDAILAPNMASGLRLQRKQNMIEQNSATAIGKYGYTHWTGKPVTPGQHMIAYVPQTIADGWEAYCSCGEWRCFVSIYEIPETMGVREATLAKLKERFQLHIGVLT
jgi:hypothetical protein